MIDQGYLGEQPIRSVLGNFDVSALLDFIDEPRRRPDWQAQSVEMDKADHRAFLRRIGVRDLARPWIAQRVQTAGTLAALWGAVL